MILWVPLFIFLVDVLQGTCIFPDLMSPKNLKVDKWQMVYTPSEVETLTGKKARTQCNSDRSIAAQNDNSNVGTSAGASVLNATQSPMINDGTDCPFIVDPVLSFVKALRLKGDVDSIRKIVVERFSSSIVDAAKKVLWNSCGMSLESFGLPFHHRRDSDNRTQLSANLDDILLAFDALDSNDSVPPI